MPEPVGPQSKGGHVINGDDVNLAKRIKANGSIFTGGRSVRRKTTNVCPVDDELELLMEAVRTRFSQLSDDKCQRRLFTNRLRTLALFDAEPLDYEEPEEAVLPKELEIGYAVCHPSCGNQAYVVLEGGPQGCDRCGGTMLPVKTATYRLKRQG